jgi:RHS repeat-associated protein
MDGTTRAEKGSTPAPSHPTQHLHTRKVIMKRSAPATLAVVCLLSAHGLGCRSADEHEPGEDGQPQGSSDVTTTTQALVAPSSIVVNTGTDVGTVPGDFSVGQDGSASYRVPLWTPDSVSEGTRPSLALRYSSAAGDGRLGYGWDLAGLSEITRCQPGSLLNEPRAPIKYTSQDRFCLDGARLMFVSEDSGSSPEGTAGAIYYTLPDQQARVKVVNADALGPTTFEVRTPDGLIHTYGYGGVGSYAEGWRATWIADAADSSGSAAATYSQVRYAWSRWKTEDRFGNRMEVSYSGRLSGFCSASFAACSNVGGSCPSAGGTCAPGTCTGSGNACLSLGAACPGTEGTCEPLTHEPQALPEKISYGGGPNDTLRRSVQFYYTNWPTVPRRPKYVSGVKFQKRMRTEWIEMRAPDPAAGDVPKVFRQYRVETHPPTAAQNELLKAITECDGDLRLYQPDVSCKKATEFTYESGPIQYTLLPAGANPVDDIRRPYFPGHWRLKIADFNQDGRDDVAYRADRDWKISLSKCQADLTGCGYDRGVVINIAAELAGDANAEPYDIMIGDWNLDGFPDIAGIKPSDPGKFRYYRNLGGSGTSFELTTLTDDPYAQSSGIMLANAAGKGYPSIMRPRRTLSDVTNLSRWSPALSNWDNNGMPWFASEMTTDWNFYVADLDGDGAVDQLMRRGSGYKRLSAELENKGTVLNSTLPISEPGVPRKYYFADLNGDGISDAVQLAGGGMNGLRLFENTGNGFKNPVVAVGTFGPLPARANVALTAATMWIDLTDPGIRVYDHDGDGRDDILLVDDGRTRVSDGSTNPFTRTTMHVLLSRSSSGKDLHFEWQDLGIPIESFASGKVGRDITDTALHSNWLTSDILDANGDGRMDIANVSNGVLQVRLNTSRPPDRLTRIKDGMGHRTDITYAPMSNNTVYSPGTSCSYPQICIKRSLGWVVQSYRADNGIALNQNTTSFQYFDARVDAEVNMPLGFAKVKATYPTRVVETVADPSVRLDVALAGAPARSVRVYPFTGPAMNIYETVNVPNGTRQRSILKSAETKTSQYGKTCYVNIKDTATYEYENGQLLRKITTWHPISTGWNDYGVASTVETKVYDGNLNFVERSTGTTAYYTFSRNTWMWVPAWDSITSEVSGYAPDTRSIEYDVNSQTGAVTDEYLQKSSTDNDIYLRTTYTRTARGKLATVTQRSLSGAQRAVATIQYDSLEGIYPTDVWNALNHRTQLVTHRGLGVLGEIVDPNGASTKTTYDRFGRRRSTKAPGGAGSTWTYARDSESGSSPADERFVAAITRTAEGGGVSKEVLNRLGQIIRRERRVSDPHNEYGFGTHYTSYSNLTYRDVGTLETVTRPAPLQSAPGAATTYGWDNLGRMTSLSRPSSSEAGGGTSTIVYSGLQETRTDAGGHQTRLTRNAAGRIVKQESKNDAGSWVPTTYEYGPFGVLRYIWRTPAAGGSLITVSMTYDKRGRRRFVYDPDAHTREIRYNAFGDVRETVNGKGEVTYLSLDALGREWGSYSPTESIYTTWDYGTGGIGKVYSTLRGTVRRQYDYNIFGELVRTTLTRNNTTPAQNYVVELMRSQYGQLSRIRYPFYSGTSRIEARFGYDPNTGELVSVDDPNGGAFSWALNRKNPDGQIERETFGNSAVTSRTYYPETGRLSNITTALSAANIQNLTYKYWDGGDVKSRSNNLLNRHERFNYDAMDRIKEWRWTDASGATSSMQWYVQYTIDDLGRLTQRKSHPTSPSTDQDNNLLYQGINNAGPHAVTSGSLYGTYQYDLNGNQTGRPGGETITYTDDGLPKVISGPRAAQFEYDADGARVEKRKTASGDVIVYVDDLYEKRTYSTHTEHVHYIPGPAGAFAEVTRKVVSGSVENLPTRYLHRDNLGSVETVSCSTGDAGCAPNKTAEQGISYDPFGNRMSWTSDNKNLSTLLGDTPNNYVRFTGHEQDAEQSLINMGGRMFDPRTGRFLSPDPVVQAPFYGQNYDRYAYVFNNPLRYIDPSGFSAGEPNDPLRTGRAEPIDIEDSTGEQRAGAGGLPAEVVLVGVAVGTVAYGTYWVGKKLWGWLTGADSENKPSESNGETTPPPSMRPPVMVEPEPAPAPAPAPTPAPIPGMVPANPTPSPVGSTPGTGGGGSGRIGYGNPGGSVPGGVGTDALRNPAAGLGPRGINVATLPEFPAYADLLRNMNESASHGPWWEAELPWFRDQVQSGARWDYKLDGPKGKYEAFGNLNYGATGASLGIPEHILVREAGRAQMNSPGGSRPEWGHPGSRLLYPVGGGGWGHFGDEPKDQFWIKQGILIYHWHRIFGKGR